MLNDRIRSMRIHHGFTQQNMADVLFITLRQYQNYEGGQAKPTLEGLVDIADALNVPTDYLLGRDKYLESLGFSFDVVLVNPPRRPKSRKTP